MTGYQEPNYTQVPNDLLDCDLKAMSEAELRVTLTIVRKIIGFHKTAPEEISLTQIQKMSGLSRQGVIDGLDAAIKRGRVVRVDSGGKRGGHRYTVNFVDQSTELTTTSQASRPELVNAVDTQKKEKETTKEKDSAEKPADTPPAKPKRASTPKTLENVKPIQAVVAYRAFGVQIGETITGQTMTRINTVVKELRERWSNGNTVEADELKAAFLWHVGGRGDARSTLDAPRDAVKVAAMVAEYRTAHASVTPQHDPQCALCGGAGVVLNGDGKQIACTGAKQHVN